VCQNLETDTQSQFHTQVIASRLVGMQQIVQVACGCFVINLYCAVLGECQSVWLSGIRSCPHISQLMKCLGYEVLYRIQGNIRCNHPLSSMCAIGKLIDVACGGGVFYSPNCDQYPATLFIQTCGPKAAIYSLNTRPSSQYAGDS